jgi:hypothetical protein
MMSEINDEAELIEEEEPREEKPSPTPAPPDTARQLSRLLVGLALIGGEGFFRALHNAQETVDSRIESTPADKNQVNETEIDQMRYLMVGSLYQVQKLAMRGARKGFRFSLRASGAMLGAFYAITDNSLLRPMQKPVDVVLSNVAHDADQALRMGRSEEEQSKAIAKETISEIMDDVVDSIADNPKVAKAVQDIVGSQSMGMAQMGLDGARSATSASDDAVEGVIRRLLHMTPRKDLPESPIAGKPQYMYLPEDFNPETEDSDQESG